MIATTTATNQATPAMIADDDLEQDPGGEGQDQRGDDAHPERRAGGLLFHGPWILRPRIDGHRGSPPRERAGPPARPGGFGSRGPRPRPGADRPGRRAAAQLGPGEAVAPHAGGAGVARRDGVAALDEHETGGGGTVFERHARHGRACGADPPSPAGRESPLNAWPSGRGPRADRAAASSAGRASGAGGGARATARPRTRGSRPS